MKKTITPEKQLYREIVETLLPYADEQLEVIKNKLTPGTTYTAAEIVKKVGLNKHDTPRPQRIETALGRIGIASDNIFQQIKLCEKYAGLTGKKTHTWTVPESREIAAVTTMSFGSKRQMNEFASLMKQRTKDEHEIVVLSLADGCLRNIVADNKKCHDDSRLKLKATGYEPLEEFRHLSFEITFQQLKKMYGNCRLFIYKDAKPDISSYLNPYHVRIVIENAEGKCISSNEVIPISDDFIKIYDAEYTSSYEDDYMPPETTKTTNKEIADAIDCPTGKSEPFNSTLALKNPLDVTREDVTSASDASEKADCSGSISGTQNKPLSKFGQPPEFQSLYQHQIITYIPPSLPDRRRLSEQEGM